MPAEPTRIGINDLAQARAVLAWAAYARRGILLHALEGPLLGMGFWAAAAASLDRPLVVECGDEAGSVLQALRAGLRTLRHAVAPPQATALDALIDAHGGRRVTTGPAIRLDVGRSVGGQLGRWRFDRVTTQAVAVKGPAKSINSNMMGLVACD